MAISTKALVLLLLGLLLVFSGAVQAQEIVEEIQEEVVIKNEHPGFTDEEYNSMKTGEESFEFQAEVNRLMDIIINSLYSNRDIFIRELISNAADSLDKIRYQGLKDKTLLGEGDEQNLEIRVSYSEEDQTLTFRDTGVGMTREELKNNLGTVAKSGTTEFVTAASKDKEASSSDDALNLIGQFGVGFYSVYLVAERVTVVSKSNDDEQYVWESTAESTFSLSKDPRGNTLGRGTEITLHLRDDAEEFLNQKTLKEIMVKYSQFVKFPIYLKEAEKIEKEVPVEEEEAAEEEDFVGEEEDAEKTEEAPKTKTVTETVWSWVRVNDVKAIWTRAPQDVSEEDYVDFFRSLHTVKDGAVEKDEEPLTHIHFAAEGEISFRSILYVPTVAPSGLYDKLYENGNALKLFVRRVLISDEFSDFLPNYLAFIRGVVDSDDLPLNVSRETLAESRVIKVMAKKLTRKVLEMLRKMAEEDEEEEEDEEQENVDVDVDAPKKEKKKAKYVQFWEQFGKSIKLGLIDDRANKAKLSKLIRYKSSKSEGKWISMEDYVDNMQDEQKFIYFITGESLELVEKSPLLEKANEKDFEVLYMVDPLDEYVTQSLTEYDGHVLASLGKEGLKLGDDADAEQYEKAFSGFSTWLSDVLGAEVDKVVVSTRLTSSPCIIVTSQYGWSANMERIMKAQTFTDATKTNTMLARKTLEINPRHPLIVALKEESEANPESEELKDLADMLLDAALVQSGFSFKDPQVFASRVYRLMGANMNVNPNGEMLDMEFPEIEEEAPVVEEEEEEQDL